MNSKFSKILGSDELQDELLALLSVTLSPTRKNDRHLNQSTVSLFTEDVSNSTHHHLIIISTLFIISTDQSTRENNSKAMAQECHKSTSKYSSQLSILRFFPLLCFDTQKNGVARRFRNCPSSRKCLSFSMPISLMCFSYLLFLKPFFTD